MHLLFPSRDARLGKSFDRWWYTPFNSATQQILILKYCRYYTAAVRSVYDTVYDSTWSKKYTCT